MIADALFWQFRSPVIAHVYQLRAFNTPTEVQWPGAVEMPYVVIANTS